MSKNEIILTELLRRRGILIKRVWYESGLDKNGFDSSGWWIENEKGISLWIGRNYDSAKHTADCCEIKFEI